jgi:hypothetical protein
MKVLRLPNIKKISVRLTTEQDLHLPAYDNTKLVAINTCPTWGILRYGMHKSMSLPASEGGQRQMALECGSAAHEVFAAVRLWQLRRYQSETALADYHGPRLFGNTRYQQMLESVSSTEDDRVQSLAFCLSALETSGFYDDPRDRRRTMTNLEEACIAYIDRWDWNRMPVWVRHGDDPQSDIGIEVPFDIVLSFMLEEGGLREYRYIGRADGLHTRDGQLYLHENKTASRLDEAWQQSFLLSSQITGYCLALGLIVGEAISKAEIYGMSIPLPKNYDFGGIVRESVTRLDYHFNRWFHWFLHTAELEQAYLNDPINAPKYTHSCNRYFRPCSMIPFCTASDEEQKGIIEEMFDDEWNVLAERELGSSD